jgi:hypothetical protein
MLGSFYLLEQRRKQKELREEEMRETKGMHLLFIETLNGWDYSEIDQGLRGFNVGSKLSSESSQGIISYN